MAPSTKSRQENTAGLLKNLRTLPADILLEIVAHFDLRTLIRFAATCKLLRRDILSPRFIRRRVNVTQAAPCILAYLCTTDAKKPIALVHPTTPAALSFCHNHLSRFLSPKAAGTLLGRYKPMSSRHGLVLLRHVDIKSRPNSNCWNLCVYDPMSGVQKFFSSPPEIESNQSREHKYVLLTAADGIGYSFLLIVFEIYRWGIKVHTASSCCATWELVTYEGRNDYHAWSLNKRGQPAILHGGAIHWLTTGYLARNILRYDFSTGKMGSVKPPPTNCDDTNNVYLAMSSDGKLLKLLAIQGFLMFVWLQLPISAADGSGWSLETVIDMEEKMRSLDPNITGGPGERIEFEGSGNRTGDVVFLVVVRTRDYRDYRDLPIVFDLKTKKMHRQKQEFSLLEIDLPSRLQTMKIFS